MTAYQTNRSITQTLTGTNADQITLTQRWGAVRITNLHSTNRLWVSPDSDVAVAEAAGTIPVLPNTSRVIDVAHTTNANTMILSVVGNGNQYTVEGMFGSQAEVLSALADEVAEGLDNATSATVSFVDALRFGAQAGTRTIVATMGIPSLTLPDAATTVLTALVHVPEGWTTYDLYEWHYNPAATTDAVTLLRRVYPVTSGTAPALGVLPTGTGAYDGAAASLTPGAQDVPIRTAVTTGLAIPASRKVMLYQRRNGTTDPSAVSLQFVGYELVKAS